MSVFFARISAICARPLRVVSTNVCTDQLAMLIAAPGQLYSVSYLAVEPEASVMAQEARSYRINHGLAEEIFLMKPDLVITGTYSTRTTVTLLRRLGFRVEEFKPEESIEDIRANIRKMGALLERPEQAEALIMAFDKELANLQAEPQQRRPLAAVYYENAYTSGVGTLADDVMTNAGLENLSDRLDLQGTVKLPLEALIMNHPDVLITAPRQQTTKAQAYEILRHPALQRLAQEATPTTIPDKYWLCGTPFTLEAIRLLKTASKAVSAKSAPPINLERP